MLKENIAGVVVLGSRKHAQHEHAAKKLINLSKSPEIARVWNLSHMCAFLLKNLSRVNGDARLSIAHTHTAPDCVFVGW